MRAGQLRTALAKRTESALQACLSSEYLSQTGFAEIIAYAAHLENSCGKLQEPFLRNQRSETQAFFEFSTASGYAVPMELTIDGADDNKICDVRVWPPWHLFQSRSEIADATKWLGEKTGVYAAEITEKGLEPWLDIRGADALAVASMMKLYILIAIAEDVFSGRRSWNEHVDLRDADRSWFRSDGVMHGWPSGTRLSLQAASVLMIGESDNTAADMLLHVLGRDRLEATLKAMANSAQSRNTPFLSTSETWKLKYHRGGKLGAQFLDLNAEQRTTYLRDVVSAVSVDDIRAPDPLKPAFVDSIGWFASFHDLAVTLYRLWQLGSAELKGEPLALLGAKAKIAFPEGCVEYFGGKAGQEPGIRAAGFLARTGGRWHVVTCVANDTRSVPEDEFWAVARGVLAVAGRRLED